MGLDGVLADVELAGDLAVAHALGYQLQDLEFAAGDAEVRAFFLVGGEWGSRWNPNFLDDDALPGFGDLEAQPDAENGEDRRGQSTVDFKGVLDDQEAILGPLQDGDQDSTD